jgi:CHAT domain-containing protein
MRKSPPREQEQTVEALGTINEDIFKLRDALRRSPGPRRGPLRNSFGLTADNKIIEEIGDKLFQFLFPEPIYDFFNQNLDEANGTLSIRLILGNDVPELSSIPWETLYDKNRRSFFATLLQPLFTRAVMDRPWRLKERGRLNVLGMISNPTEFKGEPLDVMNVEAERKNLDSALKELIDEKKADLTWTIGGTCRELRKKLEQRFPTDTDGWTIFHFIGHGDFDEDTEKGILILEEDGGSRGDAYDADYLRSPFTVAGGPQLVVLNACSSAASNGRDMFSSLAADLIAGGVPAVVAMQFPVSDDMAVRFAARFYRELADGKAIHEAMACTRNELKRWKFAEWVTPVLYLQSDDGRILKS